MYNKYWLELKNVDASICGKRVLSDLNINLNLNENTVILGPNGSGKSSFLSLINRNLYPIVKPGSYIKIFGEKNINIWKNRKVIGFVSTDIDSRVSKRTTVLELVASGLLGTIGGRVGREFKETNTRLINDVLNQMRIFDLKGKKYHELSEGQRKRIVIARAIIHKPRVLILDEPFNNLDIKSKYELLDILNLLSKSGTSILHVTHRIDTIMECTNRLLFLKSGQITDDGPPEELLTSKKLSNLFEIDLDIISSNRYWQVIPKLGLIPRC